MRIADSPDTRLDIYPGGEPTGPQQSRAGPDVVERELGLAILRSRTTAPVWLSQTRILRNWDRGHGDSRIEQLPAVVTRG